MKPKQFSKMTAAEKRVAIKWTLFWDMHSGGGQKEKWSKIYIEAPEAEAKIIFQNRFGHNPERVTCTCCGDDYAIHEYESLELAVAFHLHGQTLKQYTASKDILVIRASKIKAKERTGELKSQGYVWVG